MHSGNGPHDEMDQRAIACFDQALVDVGLATTSALRQVLHDYFAWATTTTMSRYHDSADDVPGAADPALVVGRARLGTSPATGAQHDGMRTDEHDRVTAPGSWSASPPGRLSSSG